MDQQEVKNLSKIIKQEIEIEDDMIILYSGILKDEYSNTMSENDKDLVQPCTDGQIVVRDLFVSYVGKLFCTGVYHVSVNIFSRNSETNPT